VGVGAGAEHAAESAIESHPGPNALRCKGAMFPQIFGKYVLEREIAAGGMARVFLATLRGAVGFEKRLVVKQIRAELAVDEAFVRRFVEEAKTAVELSHPNIVPVYELGVEQGVYYIAMEHCAGATLAEVLGRTGTLDPEEGAYVGAEVCRALEYAHRRAGIVHRDVTPRNVLLDDEGGVRLIDFGIAAPAASGGGRREVFGSPGHMPPEQLRGDPLGPETDVFAVGTLLIEAWTGKPPFRRGTNEASAQALREKPPPVSESAPALAPLDELIAASVAFDSKKRPAGAEQLGRGLRDFLRATDSVEIARRLALRVRRAHEPKAPSAAASSLRGAASTAPDSTPPLVTPTNVTLSTATFAARDEMVEWTRKLSSIPPPLAAPSTPPEPAPEAGPSTRRLSAAPSEMPRTAASEMPRTAASEMPRAAARPGWFRWAGAALGIALAGLAGRALLGGEPRSAPPPASSGLSGVPTSEVTHAVTLPAPERVAPTPSATASSAPAPPGTPAPVRSSTRAPVAVTPVSSAEKPAPVETAPDAALRLTSDPPGVVSVEGAGYSQTSPTPVRALALRAGSYRVTFRSETYGAPVTTQVTLASGARRSVHADFRAAQPAITVR
jgi:serine/threonine-protein kinase